MTRKTIPLMALFALLMTLFNFNANVLVTFAQESTPPPAPPAEVTEALTPAATEVIVTEAAPTEPPATEPPPPQAPSIELTAEPTAEVTPSIEAAAPLTAPVFILSTSDSLTAAAGETLQIALSVSDDSGVVRVILDTATTLGIVTVQTSDPTQTSAPYITQVQISYTAPAEGRFSDSFSLTALDGDGQQSTHTFSINSSVSVTPPGTTAVTERLITYNPAAAEEAIQALLATLGAVEIARIPQIGAIRVQLPETAATTSSAASILNGTSAQAAGLVAVEPNIERYLTLYTPNDPYLPYQWGLADALVFDQSSTSAWDIATRRGSGIVVAVVDSGVDLQHPDLSRQLVAGWDFADDDSMPDDIIGHGTHVAGIIAAAANNGIGIAGVAPNARIMPIRACPNTSCPSWYIAAGIVYAVDRGAKVINLSLGSCYGETTTEKAAIEYALARGVVVVAAAGNGGTGCTPASLYSYPASYNGVISVAAHDKNNISGQDAAGYNFNDRITVSAPGIDIYSTYLDGTYTYLSGTSMATPHVAGIAAVILSFGNATTPAGVREALICGAFDSNGGTLPGYDNEMGWGIVQADWSLNWRENSSNCKIVQPNDAFESPTVISRVPFTVMQPIHTRSVTQQDSDPNDCATPNQTLWYSFRPATSDTYQISTFGSSYNTWIAVYQGSAGALTRIACGNDAAGYLQTLLTVGLTRGETYMIVVGATSLQNDQNLRLDIRPALSRTGTVNQENAPFINYVGTWTTTSYRGASGGRVMETYDNNALAVFSYRGTTFDLGRLISPTQGSLEVLVDGTLVDFDSITNGTQPLSNRAAFDSYNQLRTVTPPSGLTTGTWHQVIIRRASGVTGPVSIDTITAADNQTQLRVISGVVDDRASTYLSYTGTWQDIVFGGAYANTIKRTTQANAALLARVTGSAITIYRNTGPGYGTASIYLNGVFYGTLDNNSAAGQVNVPFVMANLTPITHTLEIRAGAGGTLDIDAIGGATPAALVANRVTDSAVTTLLYSGKWDRLSDTLAYGRTISRSTAQNNEIEFSFSGNILCIVYSAQPGGASFSLTIDEVTLLTEDTNAVMQSYANEVCSPLLVDGTHRVVLRQTTGGTVDFDAVRPERYATLTHTRGLIQETDGAIDYTDMTAWTLLSSRSAGGFSAQGGRVYRTFTDGATIEFCMIGSGFILYTSIGSQAGFWEVRVDGVLHVFESNGIDTTQIDLFDSRVRPMAYGVVDIAGVSSLTPGIHCIELRALVNPANNEYVDFDGVRVFP